ncbi:MAG: hypothetical protein KDD53_05880 [Bdellovibrionales bacterium]|nr:hypothetical protein [Bdellovibrionales bacterium]
MQEKKEPRCSHCRYVSFLSPRRVVVVNLMNWPNALIFSCLAICWGELLGLAKLDTLEFAFVALVLAVFSLRHKMVCNLCQNEFLPTADEQQIS